MPGIGVFNKPPLEIESAETASFTASAGYIYPVNLGSVTADLVLTFPSSPAVDDRFAVYVSSTHSSGGTSTNFADRPYFCIEPANSTSINGSSYSAVAGEGSGKYGLWLAGEYIEYVYDGSTWLVAVDGRTPHVCIVTLSSDTGISDSTPVNINWTSENSDNASLHSTSSSTDRIYYKRSGLYEFYGNFRWADNSTGRRNVLVADSSLGAISISTKGASSSSEDSVSALVSVTAANYGYGQVFQTSGGSLNLTTLGTNLAVAERL